MKIKIICETCRSDEVSRDAWADWNVDTQSWELGAVFDYAYCHKCDGSARLEEVPIEADAA